MTRTWRSSRLEACGLRLAEVMQMFQVQIYNRHSGPAGPAAPSDGCSVRVVHHLERSTPAAGASASLRLPVSGCQRRCAATVPVRIIMMIIKPVIIINLTLPRRLAPPASQPSEFVTIRVSLSLQDHCASDRGPRLGKPSKNIHCAKPPH